MLKILFVDDEKTVLRGLLHIFSRYCPEYEIVAMVQSAQDALHVLERKAVDVVITDVKMPDMDGIQLTCEIRERFPNIEIIILSGYDDFEFVRQTLKFGAFDYLLKPCRYQRVLEVLQNLKEKVELKDKMELQNRQRNLLNTLVLERKPIPDDLAIAKHLQMALISGNDYHGTKLNERVYDVMSQWGIAMDDVEILPIDDYIVILFLSPLDKRFLMKKFYLFRQNMLKKGCPISIVILGFDKSPYCLNSAYDHCQRMIKFLSFNELSVVMDAEQYMKYMELQRNFEMNMYFSGLKVGKHLLHSDFSKVHEFIENIFGKLALCDYLDPARFKEEVLKELVQLEQFFKEHGYERPFGDTDYLSEAVKIKTFRMGLKWLKELVISMALNMKDEHYTPQFIKMAIHFIEKNYMNDLSLKDVSDQVYLNPWYFSSQFKKHIGLSFREYLNHVRVRMAKEFLKQCDLKVYQVAEMVGFQDAAYFSTVFKNIEMLSPKAYQKISIGPK